jgi:hypothetical protein
VPRSGPAGNLCNLDGSSHVLRNESDDKNNGGREMLKYNVINILGTFAALALSFLFLVRAAAPAPAESGRTIETPPAAKSPGAVEILSFPADAIIIEALPATN